MINVEEEIRKIHKHSNKDLTETQRLRDLVRGIAGQMRDLKESVDRRNEALRCLVLHDSGFNVDGTRRMITDIDACQENWDKVIQKTKEALEPGGER